VRHVPPCNGHQNSVAAMRVPHAPKAKSSAVAAAMRGNRSLNTRPEMRVRRLLFQMGYRYRLHRRDVPGRPDICFVSRRKVIFVNGCFWHQHSTSNCPLMTRPRTNVGYWSAKLQRNVERDASNRILLRSQGWRDLTVWECETKDSRLKQRLRRFLGNPKTEPNRSE
jgi:DNA mismatch endonuclease (patch repair protein)